jgi:hypothetical protein
LELKALTEQAWKQRAQERPQMQTIVEELEQIWRRECQLRCDAREGAAAACDFAVGECDFAAQEGDEAAAEGGEAGGEAAQEGGEAADAQQTQQPEEGARGARRSRRTDSSTPAHIPTPFSRKDLVEAGLMASRNYGLLNTSYKNCFVGSEVVTWLVDKSIAGSRESALEMCRTLLAVGVIHHVCGDHHFEDDYFFYRYVSDDNTPPAAAAATAAVLAASGKSGKSATRERGLFRRNSAGGSTAPTVLPGVNKKLEEMSRELESDGRAWVICACATNTALHATKRWCTLAKTTQRKVNGNPVGAILTLEPNVRGAADSWSGNASGDNSSGPWYHSRGISSGQAKGARRVSGSNKRPKPGHRSYHRSRSMSGHSRSLVPFAPPEMMAQLEDRFVDSPCFFSKIEHHSDAGEAYSRFSRAVFSLCAISCLIPNTLLLLQPGCERSRHLS